MAIFNSLIVGSQPAAESEDHPQITQITQIGKSFRYKKAQQAQIISRRFTRINFRNHLRESVFIRG
jgi:hypothetical protein